MGPQLQRGGGGGGVRSGTSQEEFYFGCFYRREMTASELVELLGRLASCPSNSAEAELLARMLRTLFTECRHFPKYPPLELHMTGEFFGRLIRSELLLKRPELQLLAIRCVMEALRIEVKTNIFRFGLVALREFLPIAPCSPAFLSYLPRIQGLKDHFAPVVLWAERCLALMPPEIKAVSLVELSALLQAIAPNQLPSAHNVLVIPPAFQLVPSPTRPPPTVAFGNVPVPDGKVGDNQCLVNLQGFGLGQVETLMDDPAITAHVVAPPDSIKNKIGHIFNSLVRSNLQQKAAELLSVMQPEWYPWVSFYMVKTRASKEPNHHTLYADFAEALGHTRLTEMLTNLTYDCINVLLKYVVSAREYISYRTVLKSLGSWLGLLTLAHNRPLRSKSFDIKHTLYDAFERGVLIAVLPLVCAVLEHMKSSRIFKLPNPWVVSHLACLASLYSIPNLKQGILFEIELLMRSLGLQLSSFIGQGPNIFETLTPAADSPDFQVPPGLQTIELPPVDQKAVDSPVVAKHNNLLTSESEKQVFASPVFRALTCSAVISRSLSLFQRHPDLRIAVPLAIERAVRDLVTVISERAVVLAVGTSVELVLKDFCLESDETLVKRAAHLMAASLGGSIVMVTGRSPLRQAIIQNLKELIKAVDSARDDELIEQTAQVIAQENLQTASILIEQAVIEHAVKAVQEALSHSLAARRAASQRGEAFVDSNFFGPGCKWPAALPPMLALTPGLDARQLQVYRTFSQIGPLKRLRDSAAGASVPTPVTTKMGLQQSLPAIADSVSALKDSIKRIMHSVHAVETQNATPPPNALILPPSSPETIRVIARHDLNNDIYHQMNSVVALVQNCDQQEVVALSTARRLLRSIYDAAARGVEHAESEGSEGLDISGLYLETFVALLKRFDDLQLVHNLREVVTIWLISATYLAPSTSGGNSPTTSQADMLKALDFRKISRKVALHALLVLDVAAKYSLVDVTIVDNDFIGALCAQAIAAEETSHDRVAITLEFGAQASYSLAVDYSVVTSPHEQLHNTLQSLQAFLDQPRDSQLAQRPLSFNLSLAAAASAQSQTPLTLHAAVTELFRALDHRSAPQPDRCLTIADVVARRPAAPSS